MKRARLRRPLSGGIHHATEMVGGPSQTVWVTGLLHRTLCCMLSRSYRTLANVSGRRFVVRGRRHEPFKMIAGPGKDLKTDRTEHAVIFVYNLSDRFHQRIAASVSLRFIELDKELAKFALDPAEKFDRKLPVSGPCDECCNEADLQQMVDLRAIGLAAAQPLKIESRAQYESRSFFAGHGKQQRLDASRGLPLRFSVGHGGFRRA